MPPTVIIDGSRVVVIADDPHSDGILIRSNNDTVRGLKLINFKRAGVAVAPVCPSDNVGCTFRSYCVRRATCILIKLS